MKVRELIEKLKKLDPEKNIWVCYDGYAWDEPDFTEEVVDPIPDNNEVQLGDYYHRAF